MRVLLVLFGHPIDTRIVKELHSLGQQGHEVHVLGMCRPGKPAEEVLKGAHVHRRLRPASGLLRFLGNCWFRITFRSPYLERELSRFIAEIRPDAIQVADLPGCRSVLNVAGSLHIPVVADFHERYPDLVLEWKDVGGFQGFKNRVLLGHRRWLDYELSVLRSASRIICTSPAILRLYHSLGVDPEKLHLVMNAVSLPDFDSFPLKPEITEPWHRDRFVLGYFGGILPLRGVKVALESMVPLRKQCPQARFVVVGSGLIQSRLEALAARLGLGDAVLFAGRQPYHLVSTFLAGFDVCVLAQQDTPHNRLALSNKIFEYMAACRPVIVSDVGETARLVRETRCGLIFRAGDVEDFAAKALLLYRDPHLRRRLGRNGRRAVEQAYNWGRAGTDFCAVYQSLRRRPLIPVPTA